MQKYKKKYRETNPGINIILLHLKRKMHCRFCKRETRPISGSGIARFKFTESYQPGKFAINAGNLNTFEDYLQN